MARNQANTILGALVVVVAIVMAALPTGTGAQPSMAPSPAAVGGPGIMAPAPGPDCMTALLNMSDCLTFVTIGSNLSKPDKPCCPELSNLVENSPICLCELLANPGQAASFQIDFNKALKLPSVCHVQTPPVSTCAAFGIPVAAPMPSEGPSSPSALPGVQEPSSASPGGIASEGSPQSPTSTENANGGVSIATTRLHFFVGLAIVILTNSF